MNSDGTVASPLRCVQNRVGSISELQFELGKVLVDISSWDRFVFSG